MATLGERIKERRKEKGFTQYELAEKTKLTVDMIRGLEGNRKNPSIDSLTKLSDVLECSADYLIGRTDDPTEDIIGFLDHELESMISTYEYVINDIGEHLDEESLGKFKTLKELASKLLEQRKPKDPS